MKVFEVIYSSFSIQLIFISLVLAKNAFSMEAMASTLKYCFENCINRDFSFRIIEYFQLFCYFYNLNSDNIR